MRTGKFGHARAFVLRASICEGLKSEQSGALSDTTGAGGLRQLNKAADPLSVFYKANSHRSDLIVLPPRSTSAE